MPDADDNSGNPDLFMPGHAKHEPVMAHNSRVWVHGVPSGTVTVGDVSRVEVIDANGRALVRHNLKGVVLSMQDNGRTLKIFIEPGHDLGPR